MNRRGFLSFLGLSPAMYAVDKRSLWDSVKAWLRPEPEFDCADFVSPEALRLLNSQLAYQDCSEEFGRELQIGDTIRVKFPSRFIVECDKCNIF